MHNDKLRYMRALRYDENNRGSNAALAHLTQGLPAVSFVELVSLAVRYSGDFGAVVPRRCRRRGYRFLRVFPVVSDLGCMFLFLRDGGVVRAVDPFAYIRILSRRHTSVVEGASTLLVTCALIRRVSRMARSLVLSLPM